MRFLVRTLQVFGAFLAMLAVLGVATRGGKVVAPVVVGLWMAAMLFAAAQGLELLARILKEFERR